MLRQDARNIGTQVRTHRTQGTQKIRRLRQDATPTDQTQDPFLLMYKEEAQGGGGAATSVSDAVEGKWGVRVHQTQEMKGKRAREIREDRTQRADAIRPEAGSVRPEKKVFLLMHFKLLEVEA